MSGDQAEIEMADGGGVDLDMEEVPKGPEARREIFNAAYNNLETAIRNFSKEKLIYQQKLEGLKVELAQSKDSYAKLNLKLQETVQDVKTLTNHNEENEQSRIAMVAVMENVEQKLESITEVVDDFSKLEQELLRRYEETEKFLYGMKYRQLQFYRAIREYKKKCQFLENGNRRLESAIQEKINEHQVEKTILTTEADKAGVKCDILEKDFMSLQLKLQNQQETFADEKRKLSEELEAKNKSFLGEKEKFQQERSKLSDEMDSRARLFLQEKENLKMEHEKALKDNELLQQQMKYQQETFAQERSKFSDDTDARARLFIQEKENLKMEHEKALKDNELLQQQMKYQQETFAQERSKFSDDTDARARLFIQEKESLKKEKEKVLQEKLAMHRGIHNVLKEKESLQKKMKYQQDRFNDERRRFQENQDSGRLSFQQKQALQVQGVQLDNLRQHCGNLQQQMQYHQEAFAGERQQFSAELERREAEYLQQQQNLQMQLENSLQLNGNLQQEMQFQQEQFTEDRGKFVADLESRSMVFLQEKEILQSEWEQKENCLKEEVAEAQKRLEALEADIRSKETRLQKQNEMKQELEKTKAELEEKLESLEKTRQEEKIKLERKLDEIKGHAAEAQLAQADLFAEKEERLRDEVELERSKVANLELKLKQQMSAHSQQKDKLIPQLDEIKKEMNMKKSMTSGPASASQKTSSQQPTATSINEAPSTPPGKRTSKRSVPTGPPVSPMTPREEMKPPARRSLLNRTSDGSEYKEKRDVSFGRVEDFDSSGSDTEDSASPTPPKKRLKVSN